MQIEGEAALEGYDKRKGHRTRSAMVTGKAYRSIGVILVVGGILYLFMATKMGIRYNVQDVVVFQPIPTDDVKGKDFQVRSQRLKTAPRTDTKVTPRVSDVEGNRLETSPIRQINQVQTNSITGIPDKASVNAGSKSPGNANKVVKKIGGQHSDEKPIFPKKESYNAKSKLADLEADSNTKNVTVLSDKKIVIIIAYMRTGSTLTASVLQQYPGTFYVFEPFRNLNGMFKDVVSGNQTYTTLRYIHGKERKYAAAEKKQVLFDEINSWLTCHLDSINLFSLTDEFHKHYTKIMKTFYYCAKGLFSRDQESQQGRTNIKTHQQLLSYVDRTKSIDLCLKTAISSCQKAPLVVLKFIRLRMGDILSFLPLYSNMKIIHLVRDARGILNSRFKVNAISQKSYQQTVNKHCSSVIEDLKYSKRILERYTDRLKIMHYEDMAENPLETSRSLAEFAGIDFLQPMQDFIRKQTSSTRDSCAYCTQRRNSSITAHKWRTQLNPQYASYIYDTCKISNDILGYLPLTTSTIRDFRIPFRKKVDVNKELLKSAMLQ